MHSLLLAATTLGAAIGDAVELPIGPEYAGKGASSSLVSETIGFLPRGLTSFGAASHGGVIYVLGGYHGTPHEYSREGQSGSFLAINSFDARDVRALDDVEPVQSVELVAWEGKLIRVGGLHAKNARGENADLHSSNEVALFDPATGAWAPLPDLPEPRSSHRAVIIDDALHVVGGWTMRGSAKTATWCSTHLSLDLAVPEAGWTIHQAPFRSRALGAARYGDSLCVVGGMTPDKSSVTRNVWILDPASETWRVGPEFPGGGFGVAATSAGRGVVASAGTNTLYRLAELGDRWHEVGALKGARIFHELIEDARGSLVALGGIAGMSRSGRIRSIERIARGVDVDPVERFVVPAPCSARNRFGFFLDGRSLVLFGGNNSLGQHDFEPENFVRETWRFDIDRLGWTRLADAPEPRQTIRTARIAEASESDWTGIAVGGFGWHEGRAMSCSTVWTYDAEFDSWSAMPGLPGTRSQFGLAQHGGDLWVIGGLDYDPERPRGEQFHHCTDILKLAVGARAFEPAGTELPGPRRAFASASTGDEFVLVGGMRDGFELVEETIAFNFERETWRDLPSPSKPRVGADLVPVSGALYLIGGSSPRSSGEGLESNPSIERFDPQSESWSTVLDDVGCEVKHARAFEVDGCLHLFTLHRSNGSAELVRIDVERIARQERGRR